MGSLGFLCFLQVLQTTICVSPSDKVKYCQTADTTSCLHLAHCPTILCYRFCYLCSCKAMTSNVRMLCCSINDYNSLRYTQICKWLSPYGVHDLEDFHIFPHSIYLHLLDVLRLSSYYDIKFLHAHLNDIPFRWDREAWWVTVLVIRDGDCYSCVFEGLMRGIHFHQRLDISSEWQQSSLIFHLWHFATDVLKKRTCWNKFPQIIKVDGILMLQSERTENWRRNKCPDVCSVQVCTSQSVGCAGCLMDAASLSHVYKM